MIYENCALVKRTEKKEKILKIGGVLNCIEVKKTIPFSVNLIELVISQCKFQKINYGKNFDLEDRLVDYTCRMTDVVEALP